MEVVAVERLIEGVCRGVGVAYSRSGHPELIFWDIVGPVLKLFASYDCEDDVLEVTFQVSLELAKGNSDPSPNVSVRMFPLSDLRGRLNIFEQKARHWLANRAGLEWSGFNFSAEDLEIRFEDSFPVSSLEELRNWVEIIDKMVR